MTERLLVTFALMAVLGLGTSTVMAKNDKDKHKGNPHGNQFSDDDKGWDRRDGYEYRTYRDVDGRPPGWSRGKKTGWSNCGLPPGQAKKYGCRAYTYQGRPHYYYQDDDGRVIVRRPMLEIHGSVDIVR
jgi:hypothetical protein